MLLIGFRCATVPKQQFSHVQVCERMLKDNKYHHCLWIKLIKSVTLQGSWIPADLSWKVPAWAILNQLEPIVEYTGPISVLWRSKKAMARVYMWQKTGSYRKLVNNGSCTLDAAMRAVLPELDIDSSLKEDQRTAQKAFLGTSWL